jgi:Uma2 family endonuclease
MAVATLPTLRKTERHTTHSTESLDAVVYPESDGLPMADNSKQFREITTTEGNIEILCEDDPTIFVAGDMFWYPVEGHPEIRQAPDVMVVFGRSKGDRGSYKQWEEENIPPQVVFEILSPGNRKQEMDAKFAFYEQYGVEEYYLYDPDRGRLRGWLRDEHDRLQPIARMSGWRSPRLKVRFEMEGLRLQLYFPDGRPFLTFVELDRRRRAAEERVLEATESALEARELAMEAETKAASEAQARAKAEAKAAREAQARAEAEAKILELQEKLRLAGLS